MKNRFMSILICILIVFTAGISIPKQFNNGVNRLNNEALEFEAWNAVETINSLHFNSVQRVLSLNQKVLSVNKKTESCYETTVQFYTFFGIPFKKVKANCDQIAEI
ncbi:hypothetical protein [Metabacillus arenae]|uniref:Uncharacterized protein n=1 Tax=Metabacillus arenae TaxID=2771434 RepID=A0A926RY50_9BACI|nr:hypothetical protein [Metabacillus arenae]MBD1382578.1 hypothetical protein [Metabacillus arenae]